MDQGLIRNENVFDRNGVELRLSRDTLWYHTPHTSSTGIMPNIMYIQDLTAHVSLDGSFEQSQSLTRWCYKPTICFSWWFAGALLLKLLILTRKRRCGIECCIHISYGPYGHFLSKLLVWILCWSANLAKSEQRQKCNVLKTKFASST